MKNVNRTKYWSFHTKIVSAQLFFFAERSYSLPIEYYDSIKGQLSDSYAVIVRSECYIIIDEYMKVKGRMNNIIIMTTLKGVTILSEIITRYKT